MSSILNTIRRICAVARLIILDGVRRHAVIGLVLFALSGAAGGLFFFDFITRDIGRATNDFLFSIFWLTGFLFLLFHSVQVLAWDNDRGALHTFLARPVSRTEYALGLFVGLAILLLLLNIILGGMGWVVLNMVRSSVDVAYFQHLSIFYYLLAWMGLYWIQLTILAIIVLFSSSVRGSFAVLLLTLCYYFTASGLPVVRESLKQQELQTEGSQALGLLLKWLSSIFPDFSLLDFKTFVTTSDPTPGTIQLMFPFVFLVLYVVIALWLACIIYERRDL